MKVEYCPENNPLTCVVQTIFGLAPIGSLFYFNWITSKYIKAEGYTQSIPTFRSSHIYKLIGSTLLGILSLVRVILEITQNQDSFIILSYIIYGSLIIISGLLTFVIRQEYIYLGYTTPFVRTFLLVLESCYATMLILSEIFPGGESVNGFTAKEVFQILILTNILITMIICFLFKSDTKNPSHVEIADLGFKLKKVYSSSLLKKLNSDKDNSNQQSDISQQYLQKSIITEYLSQNSGPSQIKTIQSNEFSYYDGNGGERDLSQYYKIKLENVGVYSIKVLFQERKKDPESKQQIFLFKIQIRTKTDEVHETVRSLKEFLDYLQDIKQFLPSLQYIYEQVLSFDQKTKDKTMINQLTSNLGKILKYIVENDYMNAHFYELAKSNFEQIQYGKKMPKTPADTPSPVEVKETKQKSDKKKKSEIVRKDLEKNEISPIEQNEDKSQQVEEINQKNEQQGKQNKESQSTEKEQYKQIIEDSNNNVDIKRVNDIESPPKQPQQKQEEDNEESQEEQEESKENPSELPVKQKNEEQNKSNYNEFERSLSYHVSRKIEPIETNLKQYDEESNVDQFQRTQSIVPQNNLIRNSMKVESGYKKQQIPETPYVSVFYQVQFIESKIVDSYAVYVFKIKERQSKWETVIEKRYSQFEKLHSFLKPIAKGNKEILPSLPYKNNDSGIFTSSRDQTLIKYRSSELKKYLQKLLLDKIFNKQEVLLQFINYEQPEVNKQKI